MDHNNLHQLRYFKLHLPIPINRCSHLPKSLILFYLSSNEAPLEINGVRIPLNKSASIILRRLQSTKAVGESEVVFVSIDRIFVGDGLSFEVCIHEEKALKGIFRQGARRTLDSEIIILMMETEICLVTDQGFLIREKVESRINRFYPKLTSILEEHEEDHDDNDQDVKQVIKGSDDSDCAKKEKRSRNVQ
ncbi:hypothetical protein M5K25_007022 [Dendrobium thyrsiflorum]|uniref:Uncharacterized protein n=1 Tax=Dendrobium thyrsiflorum TaxID=117978 RepID=A0ABD0VCP0_DENTH